MAGLELSLLGGYAGRCGSGRPLAPPTRKAWALLAYLALNAGRPVSRERLATLLWGERFDEQARQSLRQTLYELRGALDAAAAARLVATRDAITLEAAGLEVDAARFEALVANGDAAALAAADALYRGPLLAGLETSEAAFDAWLAAERTRLDDLACRGLLRLAEHRLAEGDGDAATDTARRLLGLDPLHEPAHRLLMRALAAAGRRGDALKHYQDLEALLQSELGVRPEAETQALRDALRQGDDPPLRQTAAPGEAAREPGPATSRPTKWRWAAALATSVIALAAVWILYPRVPTAPADRLSIAVLPFANLSGDARLGRVADGLTEDLITALSRVPQLRVIARSSVRAYKGKAVKVQQVAAELGVGHLLEGSIQRSGDRLRITAQLIDATTGHHLWAERHDRPAREIFALQDEIVRRILIELQVELTAGDNARIASRGTENLEAWLLRVQGLHEGLKFTRVGMARARELLQRAHNLDPAWARPLAGLAWIHWYEARRGWTDDHAAWIDQGVALAERAIALDPTDPLGYMQLGNLVALNGDYDRGVALREKAVALAPNDFLANWGLGSMLTWVGRPERALEALDRARRVSPHHPASFTLVMAQAQFLAARPEAAMASLETVVAQRPDWTAARVWQAMVHADFGDRRRAKAAAVEVLRRKPDFTISEWLSSSPYKDPATDARQADLLRRAGLPD